MGRFWSLMFLLVPILGVAVFVIAAMTDSWPLYDHWLPEDVSSHGHVIDGLFIFILGLTGVIFIGTSLALFWFLWAYDGSRSAEAVTYSHGSHVLEVVWSIIPAAALLFIAVYQMNAWADAKLRRPLASPGADGIEGTADDIYQPPLVEVTGRQFEWLIRYAGADGEIGTPDDIHTVNDLHIPVDEDVVIRIHSQDVLHSFFLPNLRIKQDVVPGMTQFVWFRANRKGRYDIVCAELCGWGHYKMRGRLTIEDRESFDKWLADTLAEQELSVFSTDTED